MHLMRGLMVATFAWTLGACTASSSSNNNSDACSLNDNTSNTSTVNSYGCYLQTRDTTSCQASREAQGLTGFWLKFSCRVTLTKSGSNVTIVADSQPDYTSNYFATSNNCYAAFSATGRNANPNSIAAQSISMTVPFSPTTGTATANSLGVIGIAANGVAIYNNAAAPGDSIYAEVATFDKCQGHPDNSSRYHYHIEPDAISSNDSTFIGVLRDGNPVYGRKDSDGSTPTLNATTKGHTGTTPDSTTAIFHYHVHLQTSGSDSAYFINNGYYNSATIGSCTGC